MGDERDAFVAYFSLVHTALFAVGSLLFFLWGVTALEVFWSSPFKEPNTFGKALIWFLTLGSVWVLIEALRRFFDKTPAVQIDRRGWYCHRRKRIIPWEYVRAVSVLRQLTPGTWMRWEIRHLLFDVDPEFDTGMWKPSVWFRDMNFGSLGKSDSITDLDLECRLDDVLEAVRKYAPERLASMLD